MPHKQTEEQAKRAFSHGSGQAGSDMASDPKKAIEEHRHIDAPSTRPAEPSPEGEKHDHMAEREAEAEDRQEALLDEALEETFPGSDPISPKHIT
jgi:hypothetical protein